MRVLAALSLVLGVTFVVPSSAFAAPKDDLQTVQRKVKQLGVTVEKITEEYNNARIELNSSKRKVSSLNKRIGEQQKQVEKMRDSVSSLAAGAYMGASNDLATLTAAKSPQDLVDKAATLQQLSQHDQARIDKFSKASASLSAQRKAAAKAMASQKSITKKLKSKKASILKTLAKQKEELAKLTNAGLDTVSRDGRAPNVPLPSGSVGAVIAFAKAQLGKPYSWGAAGPGSYDCSGLTMMAWKQGGVSLPHSSQSQQSSGTPVDKSQLQPGDLVFFGSPVHHVGLYVGGGQMIHAPNSGEVVKYTSLSDSYYQSEYSGATRPR